MNTLKDTARKPFQAPVFLARSPLRIIGAILLIFFFLLPIIRLLLVSFTPDAGVSLSAYQQVFTEAATWRTLWNTVYIVVCGTAISLVLGVSTAWVMTYTNVRGKKLMQLFIYLPFLIPSYISTLAWVQFFGNQGPLTMLPNLLQPNLYSPGGIIFVLGISHYPLVHLMTAQVLARIPRDAGLAAAATGAKRMTVLRKIIIPMALPGICSGGLLAFLSSLDNFGVPAILGIPANVRVLSTYIYEQVIGYGPSAFSRAAALSVLLGIIALAATLIQAAITRKSKVNETSRPDSQPRVSLSKGSRNVVEAGLWTFFLLTSLVPFMAMAAVSLIRAYGLDFSLENISLANYHYLLAEDPKVLRSVRNSVLLAGGTTVFCLLFGTLFAYVRAKEKTKWTQLLEVVVTVPYALPGTVLALCIILMWLQPLPGWYPGIYGTPVILLLAYVTRFFVLQFRGSSTAFAQLDSRMEEAAQTSGAGSLARWKKILLPLLSEGIISGALLVFLTALTELTVSSLLWSSGAETIGVMVFSFEQAGYSTYSTAFSSLIVLAILIAGVVYLVLQQMLRRRVNR